MSVLLLALLLGAVAGGWSYFQLNKRSIARGGKNLVGAAVVGLIAFIVILTLGSKFLPK